MNVSRGDIVLVDYPFSDRTGSKVRPTVVVSADVLNQDDDVIVAAITSVQRTSLRPAEFVVDPAKPDGQGSGLLTTSTVACWNLATIDRRFVLRRLGRLSRGGQRDLDSALRMAFQLGS